MTNDLIQNAEILERIDRFRRQLDKLKRSVHSTADRRVDEPVSEHDRRLHLLLTDTSDVISIVDDRGVIRYESPSAIRIFGACGNKPRTGTSIFSFCHPEDLKEVVDAFVAIRRQPRVSRNIAHRFRHADGSWINIESTYRNLLDEASIEGILVSSRKVAGLTAVADRTGVVGIMHDNTDLKQSEEKLRQLHKADSLNVLVGGVAHNFNNILGVIMGYASMLEDPEIGPEKFNQYVRIIIEGTERGAHLVQQLMTYVRKTPVRYSDVAVGEVIREKIRMAMETFPQTVLFSVDLDSRELVIRADRDQFGQVLFNLFLNARDAMPDGGTITVSSGVVRGGELRSRFAGAKNIEYVRVTVGDTGTGIDEEIRDRIYEPFFTTKEAGEGFGLGLSVVRGIIENHHGFIDTESTAGDGSAISVYIPHEIK